MGDLSAERIRLGTDFYEMEADIGMPSMHGKCLDILLNRIVAKTLSRTICFWTGYQTATIELLRSRPG